MRKILSAVFIMSWLAGGCAGTNQANTEPVSDPVVRVTPGKVSPGMSRQDVIVALGPPMLVTRKSGLDTEFLVYHLPANRQAGGDVVPLYIAIDEGKVSATGSASDFGLE